MSDTATRPRPAFYDAGDVGRLLDYPGCVAAMRSAMIAFTHSASDQPLRTILPLADGKMFAQMPGFLPDGDFGAKLIAVVDAPGRPGRSAHRGVVVLFDGDDGHVRAIADAGAITEIRTAAATAMATDALARADARRLAIFGCGAQAATHVHALATVRAFDRVDVWGRDPHAAARFAARLADETGLDVRPAADPAAAARAADVICTVTGSPTPVLLGAWVSPGTHVNAVGSSRPGPVEVDAALVLASRYVADSRRSVLAAGAEFLDARTAGLIDDGHIVAEIGEVLLGRVPGRTGSEDITLYKSLGHVVQDLAAVAYVDERARHAAMPAETLFV